MDAPARGAAAALGALTDNLLVSQLGKQELGELQDFEVSRCVRLPGTVALRWVYLCV